VFERFTERARQVVVNAQEEARAPLQGWFPRTSQMCRRKLADGSHMDLVRTMTARLAALVLSSVLLSAAVATAGYAAPSVTATAALASNHSEPLAGTWAGEIAGQPSSGVRGDRIVIVVNASETGGSWKLSATCHGSLTLDNISSGYHHYLRKLVPGATCASGDVDCLKQVGANLYDAVTSHLGGAYDLSGTLRRVLPR
jgi:hypothetical protein